MTRRSADLECDAVPLQLLALQHFLMTCILHCREIGAVPEWSCLALLRPTHSDGSGYKQTLSRNRVIARYGDLRFHLVRAQQWPPSTEHVFQPCTGEL
jgi:hypothetical protein